MISPEFFYFFGLWDEGEGSKHLAARTRSYSV